MDGRLLEVFRQSLEENRQNAEILSVWAWPGVLVEAGLQRDFGLAVLGHSRCLPTAVLQ